MTEHQLAEWALTTGGPFAVLTVVLLAVWRRDAQRYTDQWKGQSEALMAVVTDNTAAITELTALIRAGQPWDGADRRSRPHG